MRVLEEIINLAFWHGGVLQCYITLSALVCKIEVNLVGLYKVLVVGCIWN